VAEKIAAAGFESSANYLLNEIDHEIKLCMVDVMKACNTKLLRKHGYFDLLGCDFMVTDDNKLCLLEINTNPALSLGK
jgi:D-alanine-D-alanine ligase-like ATP-grasp enzyme